MHRPDVPLRSSSLRSLLPPVLQSDSPSGRPHVTGYTTRASSRKSVRPSTAPAAVAAPLHEDLIWLPAAEPPPDYSNLTPGSPRHSQLHISLHTLLEDDSESRLLPSDHDILPEEDADPSPPLPAQDLSNPSDKTGLPSPEEYDWLTFITAYAEGRWDPNKIPRPPLPCQPLFEVSVPDSDKSVQKHSNTLSQDSSASLSTNVYTAPTEPPTNESLSPSVLLSSSAPVSHNGPLQPPSKFPLRLPLPLPTHRFRSSFSSAPAASSSHSASTSDVHATVAAMRWAASRVDISPLALPSPESELTDPLRGFTATIPGSLPTSSTVKVDYALTPGGTQKSRLVGFWEGTNDVDDFSKHQVKENVSLPITSDRATSPIDDVELDYETPLQGYPTNHIKGVSVALNDLSLKYTAPPASAPLPIASYNDLIEGGDYFGDLTNSGRHEAKSNTLPTSAPVVLHPQTFSIPILLRDEATPSNMSTASVPALAKRQIMSRQTSSPLPDSTHPPLQSRARKSSEGHKLFQRAIKEERMFTTLGYLSPPFPADEIERRRALYKFNIWNTGADASFNRLAHLAKLVFDAKGVIISLIDCHEQWFKSEWGIKTTSSMRAHSFCGHSILQRGDEPLVVLDALKDWRFAKNPLVIGPPSIRFYAGAPLRTQDGFNIGTLAVLDDQPRDMFSPRKRHVLKELAAVVMREMELWRDKIQLRIRDRIQNSMEQFSRECLEIDAEANQSAQTETIVGSSMDRVYDRAAKLVKRTLDVEGVIVMDVSHCEVLESMGAEGSVSVTMHYGDPGKDMASRQLTTDEYHNLLSFFDKYPDGKVAEGVVPASFKPFLPPHVQYALTVPIFNVDKRPFALLCAYNTEEHHKRFLEGHELSYLRAIGVIILSAVLKRRMLLADKAKGLFISNISHELRTPLHGILAAAELLSESPLNHSQASFLQTVQACGTSLVETVNHVLDFTKLSGNSKAGGVENVIVPTTVDLMQLIEDAVDGCWIGHRARMTSVEDSGIGSVYSPPKEDVGSPMATRRKNVETVLDIGYRKEGWSFKCEKAGMRRVLMNLFGNSLKFTTDGYIHVLLRQLPRADDDPPDTVKIELAVFDTGKGISQNFLKNQLFHPFSQENPLQTGTGLGLAIVSSIVTSENVGGKVDVWSEEGVGTEIKVTFPAQVPESATYAQEMEPFPADDLLHPLPSVSLMGFSTLHKGTDLLRHVISSYLTEWWGFTIVDDGDIVIVNDDTSLVVAATQKHDVSRSFIILSAARGDPAVMGIASEYERIGGFCRILYKPGGPARLRATLQLSMHALRMAKQASSSFPPDVDPPNGGLDSSSQSVEWTTHEGQGFPGSGVLRRNSNTTQHVSSAPSTRPSLPRSTTASPYVPRWTPSLVTTHTPPDTEPIPDTDTPEPTVSLGTGGTLLKSSIGALPTPASKFRVLIVEDNSILRNLLMKWLTSKGYDFRPAVDGRDGVNVFREEGPFNVVLLDLSMPVLDGVGATIEIRKIEVDLLKASPAYQKSQILALTGMSSLEDKRRAFEAGVDGYLVKPVAFKTLDEMFHRLCQPAD